MRISLWLLISFGVLFFSTMLYAEEARKDAEKIQGRWAATTYVQDGQVEGEKIDPKESPIRWVFIGEKITFLADVEEASTKGTFKLDPTAKPKTIDIRFPPAVCAKRGKTMLGIYEIEGDTLMICYGPDGVARPTKFESEAGSKLLLIDFERLK